MAQASAVQSQRACVPVTRSPIRNRARARQIVSFAGMQNGKMMPTDIDLAFEYKNSHRILGELKLAGAEFPTGQRLLLERFIDDFLLAGKPAMAFVARHDVVNTNKDVLVAKAIVDVVYCEFQGKWLHPGKPITAKQLCNWFVQYGRFDGSSDVPRVMVYRGVPKTMREFLEEI